MKSSSSSSSSKGRVIMGHAGPTRVITGCYLARRTCSRTNTRTHARTKVSEGGGEGRGKHGAGQHGDYIRLGKLEETKRKRNEEVTLQREGERKQKGAADNEALQNGLQKRLSVRREDDCRKASSSPTPVHHGAVGRHCSITGTRGGGGGESTRCGKN